MIRSRIGGESKPGFRCIHDASDSEEDPAATRPMNTAIELHDSKVTEIAQRDWEVEVHFRPAYLHRSIGNPAIDPGTGWIQEARLFFDDGTVVGDVSDLPSEVWKGELAFAGACLGGLLPVPLSIATSAVLRLTFNTGHTVTISGRGVRLELCGEPSYVEEFHP